MEYNTSGIRTKRTSDDKTYRYIYAGDKLMRMTVGDDILDFSYDANGAPLTMTYNGTVYYYITNLQGDVMSLERADGGSGAQYAYDAWGNIIAMSGTLAELNPLRYRGYVYDQETGFYYLQSRYYDPVVGRFISADAYISTGRGTIGCNMFAYCMPAYSKQCLIEVREEMHALYTAEEIEDIFNCLQGFKKLFTFEEIKKRAETMFPASAFATDTLKVLRDMYRAGVVGNYNSMDKTQRWQHKEQYNLKCLST